MKQSIYYFLTLTLFVYVISCTTGSIETPRMMTAESNGYTYEYASNDPSGTRIYTLDNGFKVYMSVNKDEPRIFTYIPVKAGGKFDPANSTGLAHYLEHMMFKGNQHFGSKDWEAEKVYVDSIEQMFEHYRTLTDPEERKAYYAVIDKVSNEASEYVITNEYDKMCAFLGAKSTNAYTTEDRTVYMNDIPSNQLENFVRMEAARFSQIVNRLFHTELEAVYEEKNRSLDNDYWKAYEAMYRQLFLGHPYGTQTVIGTIEHLKNPSITDINAYFDKYYIPNNTAFCMAGDFDPDQAIEVIDRHFGKWESQELGEYQPVEEDPITSPRITEVFGPDKARVTIGFRLGGTSSDDMPYIQLIDYLLNNSTAGLIDLNLNQKQKVLSAGCYVDELNDYSIHTFYGEPREGQTLEEVKDEILGQIELIKSGDFEDWLIEAIVNDFKRSKMRQLESNNSRANDMVMAFTNNMEWADYISLIPKMEKITKDELVEYANEHYGVNYAVVYKREGEDPNKEKVEKPQITKVAVDRESQSAFFREMQARQVEDIQPVFIDYQRDLSITNLTPDLPLLYKANETNDMFNLYYLLETGTNENPKLALAVDYLQYLGTADMTSEEVKKEFYRLGCNFNVSSSDERTYVTLSGLDEKMEDGMALFEKLLAEVEGDDEILANLISDQHKSRADAKKNKNNILFNGLVHYARYGAESPFTNVLSNEELNSLTSDELLDLIRSITSFQHKVMYYGPRPEAEVKTVLQDLHQVPENLKPVPESRNFAELTGDPQVFWTHYDMVQAEIIFQSRGPQFDPKIAPEVRMFNEYFGGGMSSILFQEIREAQGLAYSVFSSYSTGSKKDKNDYLLAYVGTQADKQKEAMDALIHLLNNIPESSQNFEASKEAILKKIASERINKTSVFFNYLDAQDKELDYDIRRNIYERVQKMTFKDLKAFHDKYIKDKNYNVALIGDRDRLNFIALREYGQIRELSLDEIFGYEDPQRELLN